MDRTRRGLILQRIANDATHPFVASEWETDGGGQTVTVDGTTGRLVITPPGVSGWYMQRLKTSVVPNDRRGRMVQATIGRFIQGTHHGLNLHSSEADWENDWLRPGFSILRSTELHYLSEKINDATVQSDNTTLPAKSSGILYRISGAFEDDGEMRSFDFDSGDQLVLTGPTQDVNGTVGVECNDSGTDDPAEVGELYVMRSAYVVVTGLSTGDTVEVQDAGGVVLASATEVGGVAEVDVLEVAFPGPATVVVKGSGGAVKDSISPAEGVWGGDQYSMAWSLLVEDLFDVDSRSSYTQFADAAGTWVVDTAESRMEHTGDGVASQDVLIRDGITAGHVRVEASATAADDSGLVARFSDVNNYYMAVFRDDASSSAAAHGSANVEVYKRTAGAFTSLSGKLNISWPRGTARNMRFELDGTDLRVFLDGVELWSGSDSDHASGGAGFRGSGGALNQHFRELEVYGPGFSFPAEPTLSVSGITTTTADLVGSAYSEADGDPHLSSQFQVDSRGGDFSVPVYDSGEIPATETDTATGLPIGTDLDARVRYKDADGWGPWSAVAQFTTKGPPAKPTITLTAEGVDRIRMQGSAYSDPDGDPHQASRWQLDLATGDFSSPIYDSGPDGDAGNLEEIVALGLEAGVAFKGRVQYQDSDDLWSSWSDPDTATTPAHVTDCTFQELVRAAREHLGIPIDTVTTERHLREHLAGERQEIVSRLAHAWHDVLQDEEVVSL